MKRCVLAGTLVIRLTACTWKTTEMYDDDNDIDANRRARQAKVSVFNSFEPTRKISPEISAVFVFSLSPVLHRILCVRPKRSLKPKRISVFAPNILHPRSLRSHCLCKNKFRVRCVHVQGVASVLGKGQQKKKAETTINKIKMNKYSH